MVVISVHEDCAGAESAAQPPFPDRRRNMPIGTAVRHLKKGEWQKAHPIVQDDASPLSA